MNASETACDVVALSPCVADGVPVRVQLLNMPLDPLTQAQALEAIAGRINARQSTWILTPNLDILRQYHVHPEVRPLFHGEGGGEGADILLPDGMPLIWASRLARQRPLIRERVAGSSLVLALAEFAAKQGWRLYLLGGAPEAADRAAAVLQARHPKLMVAGTDCPPPNFESDAAQLALLREKILGAKPDLVYVALGFPKQERLIQQLRRVLPHATFIGVGISLSFIAGTLPRAPRLLQRVGLEWLHRLVHEPKRLAKRYLLHDLPFALFILFPRAFAQRFKKTQK